MPKVAAPKACPQCGKPRKINRSTSGRHRGYCATCGDPACVAAGRRQGNRRYKGKMSCLKCGVEVLARSRSQKYCTTCCPTKRANAILRRYKMSEPEFQAELE